MRFTNSCLLFLCEQSFISTEKELLKLDKKEALLIKEVIDGRTIDEIEASLNLSKDQIETTARRINSKIPDAIQFESDIERLSSKGRVEKAALELYKKHKAEELEDSAALLKEYHQTSIQDAQLNFDSNEITISHLMRSAQESLEGKTYGEKLCHLLLEETNQSIPLRILEIGAGLGDIAHSILSSLENIAASDFASIEYHICDLSPVLIAAQKEKLSKYSSNVTHFEGDVLELELEDSYDWIIANEMIADLPVANVCDCKSAQQLSESHDLTVEESSKGVALINLGAFRLIRKVEKILKPKGIALLTEYGVLEGAILPFPLKDHEEYEINFRHLETVAAKHNLHPKLSDLATFLNCDSSVPVLKTNQFRALSNLVQQHIGLEELKKGYLYQSDIRSLLGNHYEKIHKLKFHSLTDPNYFTPARFFSLLLRKM